MPKRNLEAETRDLIAEQMGIEPDEIISGSSFTDDLRCDSLDFAEILIAIEDRYGIEISDDAAIDIQTFGELMEQVHKATR